VSDPPRRPVFRQIIVDVTKLRDYCLSPTHPHGRHKARVFRARLGLQPADAEFLRGTLINAVQSNPDAVVPTKADHHGKQYVLDFEMSTATATGMIRSIWIVPAANEDVLRFVTCYVR
jgi:hypothetical protein